MAIYEVEGVSKRYPGQVELANEGISLAIGRGEIFGLLGDNGAGKSTLVRQMANLLAPTAGLIRLLGEPVGRDPLHVPRHVGYMPQHGAALNNLTVGEALFFTAHLRGLRWRAARQERDRLLEEWQIGPLRDKPGPRLSGGQKRLLQLAVALAGRPPVLILDEPTNDVDPARRRQVWDNLRRLNREDGVTVIFITHDAIEAEKIIQRVGIMRAGKLVALGRPADLKQAVNQKLRLELFFPPESPPALPAGLEPLPFDAGRWLLYVDWNDLGQVMAGLDRRQIEDIHLYSATLEDLYLHYARQD
jgi:ABC-type multidrug transport system ATPase subunit